MESSRGKVLYRIDFERTVPSFLDVPPRLELDWFYFTRRGTGLLLQLLSLELVQFKSNKTCDIRLKVQLHVRTLVFALLKLNVMNRVLRLLKSFRGWLG